MALLERVSTLLRANLNDLLDKAEDPEKLSKQILLDMENQLLQVKTQVAIAIADQHRLLKKRKEHEEEKSAWRRKAELAVAKGQDEMARGALERGVSHEKLAEGFARQHADQLAEAETLRAAYTKLQGKLAETKARVELLLAQHRSNRAAAGTRPKELLSAAAQASSRLSRLTAAVAVEQDAAQTHRTFQAIAAGDTLDDRFQSIEQEEQIEMLLLELKQNQPRLKQ